MVRPRHDPLPDPIPASYYARPPSPPGGAEPPPNGWARLRDAGAEVRHLIADVRAWPLQKQVLVGVPTLVGVVCAVQLPWRPALGLFGLLTLAAVVLALDVGGVRARVPLLSSREPLLVLGGWGLIGGLIMITALVAMVGHGSPSATGAVTLGQSSPAPQASGPRVTPVPDGPPLPVLDPTSPTPSATPSPTPSATPRTTPSAARVTLLNSPVTARRARPVTVRAQTAPQTSCSISIGYPGAPSLDPATSDSGGAVSWTWRVAVQTSPGSWPLSVTCGGASAAGQIVVT